MRATKTLLSLSAALLLIGAGCDNSSAVNANTNNGAIILPSDSTDTNEDTDENENDNDSEQKPSAEAPAADASWKTYTNAALGFSFKWPSTGRYAPKWGASFAKMDDARIKDGCYVIADAKKTEQVTVGETVFCHTSVHTKDDATASDYYVTKKGDQYVVLTFNKTKDGGKDFSWDDYHANLHQVVSTYSAGK